MEYDCCPRCKRKTGLYMVSTDSRMTALIAASIHLFTPSNQLFVLPFDAMTAN